MTTPTIEFFSTLAAIGTEPAIVRIELLGVGIQGEQGPAVPLVQTVRGVDAAVADSAPSEVAVAAAAAAAIATAAGDATAKAAAAESAAKSASDPAGTAAATVSAHNSAADPHHGKFDTAGAAASAQSAAAGDATTKASAAQAAAIAASTPVAHASATNNPHQVTAAQAGADPAGAAAAAQAAAAGDATTKANAAESAAKAASTPIDYFLDTWPDGRVGRRLPFSFQSAYMTYFPCGIYHVSADTAASDLLNLTFYNANTPVGWNLRPYAYSRVCSRFPQQYVLWSSGNSGWRIAKTTDAATDYFASGDLNYNLPNGSFVGAGIYAGRTLSIASSIVNPAPGLSSNGNNTLKANSNLQFIGCHQKPAWAVAMRVSVASYFNDGAVAIVALQQVNFCLGRAWVVHQNKTTAAISDYTMDITAFPANSPLFWFVGIFRREGGGAVMDDFALYSVALLKAP